MSQMFPLHTGGSASSATELESSQGSGGECGRPGGGGEVVHPHWLIRRIHWTVDQRWRSRWLFWARSEVEYL